MTSSPDFSSFLIYIPSDIGRKVYIDPELIVTFTEYVDPSKDSGKKIANDIQQSLSSAGDGLTAGKSNDEANAYYMDFGDFTGHCVRVFYKIFQDDAGGLTRGTGVYIYNLRGFAHNRNKVGAGLFHMRFDRNDWRESHLSSRELSNKVLRIGSMSGDAGLLPLGKLSSRMLMASGEDSFKTDFDLYHSPLAVIEYGHQYASPEARRKIASPAELADVIANTSALTEWSGKQHDRYTVYVYGDAAKLLVDALRLLKGSNQTLSKFEFRLLAPHVPFSLVQSLAQALGASAVLDGRVQSAFSLRHQMLDSESHIDNHPQIYAKLHGLIQNSTNISFIELWQEMKSSIALLS